MNTANLRLRDRWLLALFASLFLTVGASAQNEVEIQGRVTADGQPVSYTHLTLPTSDLV